ncbi:hypothetical protein ABN034_07640 [Actinopolymorpha sp. B11F2]|uniref:hypothetical protein n=1 Tax=Actinopolymorpha sp. B11F2 TaxID=3160862 RepID=UPI0032E371AF
MPRRTSYRSSNRVRLVEDVKPKFHQRVFVQVVVAVWRWLPEIIIATAVVTAFVYLIRMDLPAWAAGCVLVAPVAVLLCIPGVNRVLIAVWCLNVTRHRLRAFMAENGLRNRSGRLPWLIFIRPTRVGERAWMWLVAGVTCKDVEERTESLASTCYGREGRVTAHRRFAHLIRLDITRRDPLDQKTPVRSVLIEKNAEPEVIPPNGRVESKTSYTASEWAVGIGLPLTNTSEERSVIAKKALAGKAETTKNTPPKQRTQPAPEPAAVLSASGEDVSDYV